jgi:hypothetical protein
VGLFIWQWVGRVGMASTDGPEHPKAPLPADQLPPFIVIHKEHAQITQGLLLCAVIITPWPMSRAGLTRSQAETVGAVQAQLIGDHLAGRFPDGDNYAFWLDLLTGAITVLEIPSNNWVRHRIRDYLTVTLNVPKPEAEQ